MAWLHGNTFERYGVTADRDIAAAELSVDYQVVNRATIVAGAGRDGGQAVRLDAGVLGKGLDPGSATSIIGLPLRMNTELLQAGTIAIWDEISHKQQVAYAINANGSISAYRAGGFVSYLDWQSGPSSGTLLGTTPAGLITVNTYHHLAVVTTLHASAGVVDIYLDGLRRLHLTGINTVNPDATGAVYNFVAVGASIGVVDFASGFYVCDDTGAHCNAFLGDLVGEVVRPAANGVLAQWTPSSGTNAECVDDVSPDGDATRVTADSVGLSDLYTHGPLTQIADGIQCVQIVTIGKKTTSGTRALAHLVRSGGTTYPQADQYLGTDYAAQMTPLELDPATSAPWTVSNWDATQIGQKVTA